MNVSIKLRLAKLEAKRINKDSTPLILWLNENQSKQFAIDEWLKNTNKAIPRKIYFLSWQK